MTTQEITKLIDKLDIMGDKKQFKSILYSLANGVTDDKKAKELKDKINKTVVFGSTPSLLKSVLYDLMASDKDANKTKKNISKIRINGRHQKQLKTILTTILNDEIEFLEEDLVISKYGISTLCFPQAWRVPSGMHAGRVVGKKQNDGTFRIEAYYFRRGCIIAANEPVCVSAAQGTYRIKGMLSNKKKLSKKYNLLYADYIVINGRNITARNHTSANDDSIKYYKLSTQNGENVGWYWGGDDGAAFSMSDKRRCYLALPRT